MRKRYIYIYKSLAVFMTTRINKSSALIMLQISLLPITCFQGFNEGAWSGIDQGGCVGGEQEVLCGSGKTAEARQWSEESVGVYGMGQKG